MIVDGKVRKLEGAKETEKRAGVFERFKDRIEGLGKKAVILGAIGVGLGCASNGVRESTDWTDPSVELGEFMYEEAMYRRSKIYEGCITFEDSLEATKRAWANAGPADTSLIFIVILSIATYPYKDTLNSRQNQNTK